MFTCHDDDQIVTIEVIGIGVGAQGPLQVQARPIERGPSSRVHRAADVPVCGTGTGDFDAPGQKTVLGDEMAK